MVIVLPSRHQHRFHQVERGKPIHVHTTLSSIKRLDHPASLRAAWRDELLLETASAHEACRLEK